MNKRRKYIIFSGVVFIVLAVLLTAFHKYFSKPSIELFNVIDRLPRIYPDYSDCVVPPNIAPLNFTVQEDGKYYYVKIYSRKGESVEVFSRNFRIIIPQKPWRELLDANRNEQLYFNVYVKDKNNKWNRFDTVTNKIADENIDGFLVYRKINPDYIFWRHLGIYQRNLSNYDESPILENNQFGLGCINCHTFCNNNGSKVLYPTRSEIYGTDTLLIDDGNVQKLGAKFTYSCWHPSGKMLFFSVNRIVLFFHSSRDEVRDVSDMDSLVAYYVVDSKEIKTSPKLSRKEYLETYPAWSPDGRSLYFCRAPLLWPYDLKVPLEQYDKVKYDLMRIDYDIESDKWAEPETVVSSADAGLSITLPRISPDGRWLLLCMADYGCFNAYSKSSDLYIVDLEDANRSGTFMPKKLEVNSDQSESWHSWSSNSRWIVFSSKRDYGIFTRPYISYVDESGNVYKPFVLPQKDPTFYDSCLLTYNTPELVNKPVQIRGENLARVIRGSQRISVDLPITMATPEAEGVYEGALSRQRE